MAALPCSQRREADMSTRSRRLLDWEATRSTRPQQRLDSLATCCHERESGRRRGARPTGKQGRRSPRSETPRNPAASSGQVGHADVIETLVRSGSKAIDIPNKIGWTPLYGAARNGHVSVIEALVRLGSQAIDTPNNYCWTPFHPATEGGHVSVIETLVRLGSKAIDTPDNEGRTPMYYAASTGHVEIIEALVRLGSQATDTPDEKGLTPVHATADPTPRVPTERCLAALEALVRLGSKAIDAPSKARQTPLHLALQNGTVDMVVALCRLGSRALLTPDANGVTPKKLIDSHEDRNDIIARIAAVSSIPLALSRTGPWRISLLLIEARNLKAADSNGLSDPYAKLFIGGKKFKSKCIKKTLNPVWQEEFIGQIALAAETISIELWDHDRFSRDDPLGFVSVSLSDLRIGEPLDAWLPVSDGTGDIHLRIVVEQ